MTLNELLDAGEAQARRVLIGKKDQIMPLFHIVKTDGENFVLAAPWPNAEAKDALAGALRAVFRETDAVASYMFMSEAWIALAPEGWKPRDGNPEVMPRDNPARLEVVLISACDRQTETMRILRIRRGPDGACTALDRENRALPLHAGQFSNLLRSDA